MYRTHISSAQVETLIRELTIEGRLPSGAALRRELKSRFGGSGGVTRIYRLLASKREAKERAPEDAGLVADLQRQLADMRKRAELAETREEAHQMHWATEVDQLRMRLQALTPESIQGRRDVASATLLRHQLQAAEQRAARLEEQVIELQRKFSERY